jgi:hypothetical protein
MPEAAKTETDGKPTLLDKFNSRKFWIALFGMVANVLLMWKGSLSTNTGMQNLFYWGFGYMFAEAIADAGGIFKDSKLKKIIAEAVPMLATIKAEMKKLKKDGEE